MVEMRPLEFRRATFDFSRTYLMGVLNVTPDSFSDGGSWSEGDPALAHGLKLVADGADLVDVGGESTRPGAVPVSAREEVARVVPLSVFVRVLAMEERRRIPRLKSLLRGRVFFNNHKSSVEFLVRDITANGARSSGEPSGQSSTARS